MSPLGSVLIFQSLQRTTPFQFSYSFSETKTDATVDPPVTSTITSFIESIQVTRDGSIIDNWKVENSRWGSASNYARNCFFLGQNQARPYCVTLEDFESCFYTAVFNNSTIAPATYGLIPSVIDGSLRLELRFSEAIPFDIEMLIYAEYSVLKTLNYAQKVESSHVNKRTT